MINKKQTISGIIPAAGRATRLGKLPFSKELFPLSMNAEQTTVVSNHLINAMSIAGIDQLHFIIRDGKWDIPSFFGSKIDNKLPVCYHIVEVEYGVPFTVNQTYPFIKDHIVLLGFPDILFEPKNAFKKLVEELNKSAATIALGVFPISRPEKWDMVELDPDNKIKRIVIKPKTGNFQYGWVIAAWKPEFSRYLNKFVDVAISENTPTQLTEKELHFGDAIISAMESGIKVQGVVFEEGKCMDTGTPDEMKVAPEFGHS